jgi:HD superfamily phosphodiesterase
LEEAKNFLCTIGAHREKWWTITVYDHIETVARVSRWIASRIQERGKHDIDLEMCELMAWLHDVGRMVWDNSSANAKHWLVHHGYAGYLLLIQMGVLERLARVTMTHISGGISRLEIEREGLPLPHRDFLSDSIEEDVIVIADKLMWWDDTIRPAYENFLYNRSGKIYGELSDNELAWQRFWRIKHGIDMSVGGDVVALFQQSFAC